MGRFRGGDGSVSGWGWVGLGWLGLFRVGLGRFGWRWVCSGVGLGRSRGGWLFRGGMGRFRDGDGYCLRGGDG